MDDTMKIISTTTPEYTDILANYDTSKYMSKNLMTIYIYQFQTPTTAHIGTSSLAHSSSLHCLMFRVDNHIIRCLQIKCGQRHE